MTASPQEPPVGKDSSFEELADDFKQSVRDAHLYRHVGPDCKCQLCRKEVDARAALENLFAKQREEIKYLNAANDALAEQLEHQRETTLTPDSLEQAIVRTHPADDPIVKLREIANRLSRGEMDGIAEYKLGKWLDAWLDRYAEVPGTCEGSTPPEVAPAVLSPSQSAPEEKI